VRTLLSLLFTALFAAGAAAQVNITFVEYDLPNGLHVILHQDRSAPIVAQVVAYHVGSKNEKPDRTGFAHFFEHLMFEGSPNIARGEFFKMVQNAGGNLNAFTSFDQTVYFITVPSNQIELAMWMESERMLQLKVDSTGVETQRDPGPDGLLGTADDALTPLAGFSRRIDIRELNPVNTALREVVITITYTVGPQRRTYLLRTFISAFS